MIRNRGRRRGYTLMEIVTVLPALTVLLLVATGWIHYTLKFANEVKHQRNHHKTLTRFVWDVREDISLGRELSVNGNTLTVEHGEDRVSTFEVENDLVRFLEHQGNKLIRQEAYQLYPFSRVVWEPGESHDHVKLTVFRGDRKLGKDKSLATRMHVIDLETSFRVSRWNPQGESNGK